MTDFVGVNGSGTDLVIVVSVGVLAAVGAIITDLSSLSPTVGKLDRLVTVSRLGDSVTEGLVVVAMGACGSSGVFSTSSLISGDSAIAGTVVSLLLSVIIGSSFVSSVPSPSCIYIYIG